MTEHVSPPPAAETAAVPQAVTRKKKHWSLSIVWLIPLVAALIGGWLAVSAILNKGPTITLQFENAEGLEAGRTKIKYKDVDIGVVQGIALSSDRDSVVLTAEIDKRAESFLVDDTRFWVVKPRLAGSGISGLSTLLSGAYLGMDIGKSTIGRRDFVGLEVPPVLTSGLPGRTFTLKAADLGSIDYGTPVYYRRLTVGEVVAYRLDEDGKNVSIDVFIHAPYDQYVTADTRFWSASGLDVSVGAEGIKVSTESLTAVLLGGIAFATPDIDPASPQAETNRVFTLHEDRDKAFKPHDTIVEIYQLVFRESVHGLNIGAPVEFRGLPVGEVIDIGVDYDFKMRQITIPVQIRFYPGRLASRSHRIRNEPMTEAQRFQLLDDMTAAGLRGQLRTGSLITGNLYITLDFFPGQKKAAINRDVQPPEMPTITSGLQGVQTTVNSILTKLDNLPYDQIVSELRTAIHSLDETIVNARNFIGKLDKNVTPQIEKALVDAQNTLEKSGKLLSQDSPVQQDLRDALREVSRAAQSMRNLTDYLSQHPESLIRGKQPEDITP